MTQVYFKKNQISRADLIELIDNTSVQYLAKQLGLELKQQRAKVETNLESSLKKESKEIVNQEQATGKNPTAGVWRLERREKTVRQVQKDKDKTKTDKPVIWTSRPSTQPDYHSIATPRDFLPRLLHHLKHQQIASDLDVVSIVKKLGRGEYLSPIPRLSRRSLGQHLHIIEDRHIHLTPYWLDQKLFSHLLGSYLPDYAQSHAVLFEKNVQPQSYNVDDMLTDWVMPPEKSVVIVFTDLGALSEDSSKQIESWLSIARALKRRRCTLIAVIPCHANDCDVRLQTLFTLETWEPERQLHKQDVLDRREQANLLLTLLAPAIRLEPGLLRSVRLAVRKQAVYINANIEATVWQHADIQEASSVAATLNPTARKCRLEQFKQLPAELKQIVLDTIRPWRASLKEHIWFEEITSLDQNSRQLIQKQDLENANYFFQQLSQCYNAETQSLKSETETSHWYRRIEKRLPDASWNLAEVGPALQQTTAQIHQDDESYRTSHVLDPAILQPVEQPEQQMQLYQQGENIILTNQRQTESKRLAYSPLADIRLKQGVILNKILADSNSQTNMEDNGRSVQFNPQKLSALSICSLPDVAEIMIRSDEETLYFKHIQRPAWAKCWARDKYGLYAELEIKGIVQRFRWINPGTFSMGSPETEAQRDDDEDQHFVTLSQGYWLADSTVTQAFWQALMTKNPSRFSDDTDKPVERISWLESQDFIQKLNHLIPELHAQLPTEGQWEYACRSGSISPFSFGENLTPEQVNYNGGRPYQGGKKGLNRQTTVRVKSLPANSWGLYEMHGNVWEWCQDEWQTNLGTAPVTDPDAEVLEKNTAARRVVRGGSWNLNGQNVRSAMRNNYAPDDRDDNIGLRLALGHSELKKEKE